MPAIDLHHLAIKTDDVDATVEFWNNVIGSHSVDRPDFGFPGAWLQFGETMIHLYGGETALNKVASWIGRGPKASLAKDDNADILWVIIEHLRKRTEGGRYAHLSSQDQSSPW